MKDYFISYSRLDSHWAEWVASEIENKGYSCVLFKRDFEPGSSFPLQINKAIQETKRVIGIISPAYLKSSHATAEWGSVYSKDPDGARGGFIPIRVQTCNPGGLLSQYVYIDLVGLDEKTARIALLNGLKMDGQTQRHVSPFPGSIKSPPFPSALPTIWDVPYHRNPHFTGRENIIEIIRDNFCSGAGPELIQIIYGISGVGKTQTALEYIYRYTNEYNLVWWVRSSDLETLSSDFSKLAIKLDLSLEDEADQIMMKKVVRRWLSKNDKWLIVFDDAQNAKDLLDYIPETITGHIIITSRNQVWRSTGHPYNIPVWSRNDSLHFLIQRTGQTDTEAAMEIAEILGDFPLAMEEAAGYIESAGITLSEYHQRFINFRRKLMQRQAPPREYPQSISSTWGMALASLQNKSPFAVNLLYLCSFLASEDIPKEVILEAPKYMPVGFACAADDPFVVDDAFITLRKYSLVETTGDSLSIHRLLQGVIFDSLDNDLRLKFVKSAVNLLNSAFPDDPNFCKTWVSCSRLLSHAIKVAHHAERFNVALEATANLIGGVGQYLFLRDECSKSKTHLETALRIRENILEPNHPKIAVSLGNLSKLLERQGDLSGARNYLERALAINEIALGPEHPYYLRGLHAMGTCYMDEAKFGKAKSYFEKALNIADEKLGNDHLETALSNERMGHFLLQTDDLLGAKKCLQNAVSVFEIELGEDDHHTGVCVYHLGIIDLELGDMLSARSYAERAFSIFLTVFGEQHTSTRESAMLLALLGEQFDE